MIAVSAATDGPVAGSAARALSATVVGAVLLTGPRQRPPLDHLGAARACADALEPLLA